LRPEPLKAAFQRRAAGEIDDAELERIQDDAIRTLVATEERHALPLAGDGEFRRRNFNQSFAVVAGMEGWYGALDRSFGTRKADVADPKREHGNEFRSPVTQKLKLTRNAPLDEYWFVAGLTSRPATVTLISADRLTQRYDYEASRAIYPTVDAFVDDVAATQSTMVGQLHDAGCRYVHIDAPSYTAYVDEGTLGAMRSRGEDPAKNLERSMRADSAVVRANPEMLFGVHLCRGNARSRWHRSGSYDAIAERLFNGLAHQRFLLEYDDERSGSFEPLRFLPKGKVAVLGLISTKTPQLEPLDEILRRMDEAAKYAPIEQLALSPQCGFASSLEGNLLGEDDQWKKIDLMMQAAQKIWS
jgi:5-methyltetrahydropteroyltriglutamate--homocysteine methyltransferase